MITIYGTGNPDMQSSAVVMVCLCIKKQIMRERKICAQLKIKNKKHNLHVSGMLAGMFIFRP